MWKGATAGANAVLVTYPLDLVRTRLACMSEVYNGHWHWNSKFTIRHVLTDIIRKDGLMAIYKGLNPTLMGILPYAGTYHFLYILNLVIIKNRFEILYLSDIKKIL